MTSNHPKWGPGLKYCPWLLPGFTAPAVSSKGLCTCQCTVIWVFPKIGVFPPKMDGLKKTALIKMDDLAGKPTILGNIHIVKTGVHFFSEDSTKGKLVVLDSRGVTKQQHLS